MTKFGRPASHQLNRHQPAFDWMFLDVPVSRQRPVRLLSDLDGDTQEDVVSVPVAGADGRAAVQRENEEPPIKTRDCGLRGEKTFY